MCKYVYLPLRAIWRSANCFHSVLRSPFSRCRLFTFCECAKIRESPTFRLFLKKPNCAKKKTLN